jgi:hypothetical protein
MWLQIDKTDALDHMATGIICAVIFINNCLLLIGVVAMCSASSRKDGHRFAAQSNCKYVNDSEKGNKEA